MIDTHCHLDDARFAEDIEAAVARYEAAGVTRAIAMGYDMASSFRVQALSERFSSVWYAAGIHPDSCDEATDSALGALKSLADGNKCVAIGEIGLDYHWDTGRKARQKEAFAEQIRLAGSLNLPVSVHMRDATEDTLKLLKENRRYLPKGGAMHCFAGSRETAKEALDLGFYISFAGPLTFRNARNLPEIAAYVPADRCIAETDSPYLAPHPKRGERNEPSLLPLIVQKLAEFKKIPYETMCDYVTHNACSFCVRNDKESYFGNALWLEHEPSAAEVIEAIPDRAYPEVVFCGFGEPTERLDALVEIAGVLKERGHTVRLNTNGQGNLINGRDITTDLAMCVDKVNVSLNAPTAEAYQAVCRSIYGESAFSALISFAKCCRDKSMDVVLSVVDCIGAEAVAACRALAEENGLRLRVRAMIENS